MALAHTVEIDAVAAQEIGALMARIEALDAEQRLAGVEEPAATQVISTRSFLPGKGSGRRVAPP